jgi:hypothetical protein
VFFLIKLIIYLKAEFIACHYGHENTNDLLDLLKKAGYLDTPVKFVIDIKHTGQSGKINPD